MRQSVPNRAVYILQKVSSCRSRWQRVPSLDSNSNPLDNNIIQCDERGRPLSKKFTKVWWKSSMQRQKSKLARVFLPDGYPDTVHPFYLPFISWNFIQMISSSAVGVLSTQSLLYGLGLANGGLALSATLNWILKDGLGQLGGIILVSYFGRSFDVEAKKYRFLSSVLLKVSCVLEILVPLLPKYFILTASLANVLKNISWMTASATRAQIHRHLAKKDNLGDISGRASSQNTLASLFGTSIGVIASTMFLSSATSISPVENVIKCLLIITPLSLIALFAAYQSCRYTFSPRLGVCRMEMICNTIFVEVFGRGMTLRPEIVKELFRYILTPESIATREPFLFDRNTKRIAGIVSKIPLLIDPLIQDRWPVELINVRKFWISISGGDKALIKIWFSEDASDDDQLLGLLTVNILRYSLGINVATSAEKAESLAVHLFPAFKQALKLKGWSLTEIDLGPRHPVKIINQDD